MEDHHLDRSAVHARQRAQPTDTNRPQACRYQLRKQARSPAGFVAFNPEAFIAFPGDHGEDETPVPIPNTEVKGLIGEGTAGFARGRVARRRDLQPKDRTQVVRSFFYLGSGHEESTLLLFGLVA